jgi:glycosyltransferase involved in cell wall biosynthesis
VRNLHLLFIVNVDWFFYSHRLALARAARDRGARVTVAAADTGTSARIRAEGFSFIPLPISRKGTSPVGELAVFRAIVNLYRSLRPDLVHQVTIKPVIYGSLAARIVSHKAVVNAVSGLGYAFSPGIRTAPIRPVVRAMYRLALNADNAVTIFQNPDDRELFLRLHLLPPDRSVIIRGSGVDCKEFQPGTHGSKTVILAGRMLWDKGIGVFVEAARRVRQSCPDARFVLVGDIDNENRAAIPRRKIDQWTEDGAVEWWGPRTDMPAILGDAAIAVLPSLHREGLPKILLEAAACGLPLVATDIPGCREVVRHDETGLLVPPGDPEALARAMQALLSSEELRKRFGNAGRSLVEREFSEDIVIKQVLDLYGRVLDKAKGQPLAVKP